MSAGDVVKDPPKENLGVVSEEQEGKEVSCETLCKYHTVDTESSTVSSHHGHGAKAAKWSVILQLAFQSLGVVYGDIGTSPLYVYASTFGDGIKHVDDILGVLSLIIYTLTLIPLIKYVFIVLHANDSGDGGTFALYSLICRHAKVGLIPSEEAADCNVEFPRNRRSGGTAVASIVKYKLENSQFAKLFLLITAMLGTCMLIGDGVLTPCVSVISAVGGIKEATSAMTEERIVWISVAILVCLFMIQQFGTDKIGYIFAPIICVWFALIGGIGIYNFFKFDPTVIKAINPIYIIEYFRRNKKEAWISLGGIVLAITGSEALFADVGHFTVRSIQISMCMVTYPTLVLAYVGQASFLRKNKDLVSDIFFKSIPGPLYWPTFVVAVLAAIIASQAIISGAFSIIQQSISLGCFPSVKIVHTSAYFKGQIYIPEVNYLLMLACIGVTLGFKNPKKIGNAYGIAVVFVMILTSALLVLIMITIWKTSMFLILTYVLTIGSVELLYLTSVLYKFNQGGYLPLAFAVFLITVMYVWNNVFRREYFYELKHKVSPGKLKEIVTDTKVYRIPGIAIFYSGPFQGIPPIFKHYVSNAPALHSIVVLVSVKLLQISKVPLAEQFIFCRVEPKELNVFRCVVRCGYRDTCNEADHFEGMLIEKLKEFVREGYLWPSQRIMSEGDVAEVDEESGHENVMLVQQEKKKEALEREIEMVDEASGAGVVHLIGESEVVAGKGASIGKRILIDYGYNFLKRNLRQSNQLFGIPREKMLKVGMTYDL